MTATITKAREFIELVENTLGWMPPEGEPRWKSVAVEAGKLKRKMAENPRLYTWENLALAVELLRREHKPVASPTAVAWHVRRAVAAANQTVTSDIAGAIHTALTEAFCAGEPDWVERLTRAVGDARYEVLLAWEEYRDAH